MLNWHELIVFSNVKISGNFDPINLLLECWSEPHRRFHTIQHLEDILEQIEEKRSELSRDEVEILVLVAYYHDIVYDPKSNLNEEYSARLLLETCTHKDKQRISDIILATKNHKQTDDPITNLFLTFDTKILRSKNVQELFNYEDQILKEFQFVDYLIYKEKRVEFLKQAAKQCDNSYLLALADYVENRRLKVGLLCGSFNPLHIGHYNILMKAEMIFDKVIVCSGVNPEKVDVSKMSNAELERMLNDRKETLQQTLPYHQVHTFAHSLPKLLEQFSQYQTTVVKGVRGSKDFEEENLQRAYIEDVVENYSIVYIPADRTVEHVSSSGLRFLKHEGKTDKKSAEWAQKYVCDVFAPNPLLSLFKITV